MHPQRRATLLGLATVLLWSTVATAFKLSLRALTPAQLLFYSAAVALVILGGLLVVRGEWAVLRAAPRGRVLRGLALGLLNPAAYYLVLFAAYDRLPAQVAQPLNYTWALTLGLLSIPLLGQRFRPRLLVAGLVAYAGVVVISRQGEGGPADALGVGLALGSTLLWALYWIGNTRGALAPGAEPLPQLRGRVAGDLAGLRAHGRPRSRRLARALGRALRGHDRDGRDLRALAQRAAPGRQRGPRGQPHLPGALPVARLHRAGGGRADPAPARWSASRSSWPASRSRRATSPA